MPADIITQTPPATALAPAPVAVGRWRGKFHADFRKGTTHLVPVRLDLTVRPRGLEGKGVSLTYPTWAAPDDRNFILMGLRSGDAVSFELSFSYLEVSRNPWVCTGQINEAQDHIWGEWHMACLDPEACGCGGPSGPFELKRG